MNQCPLYPKCPLSDEILSTENIKLIREYLDIPGVLTKEGLTKSYKDKYCDGNHSKCARFQVAKNLGLASVPDDLLPHQNNKAQKIIKRQSKKYFYCLMEE
ncbi:hypothetical protein [Halanaerobacter jeridensis]|uniref:Uncharacterized protein n=1 Tax=Halanaerobacter jeridensis TaxID=706427 RepID=A0A938XWE8_9FIRM|nr:hypothetical protein [Halanaerobacter jeridensis]MBM7556877.1 hypothetical protein [Halanaerobacter jeridensis]